MSQRLHKYTHRRAHTHLFTYLINTYSKVLLEEPVKKYIYKSSVHITLFVINHQNQVSAIKTISILNTIVIGNIYNSAMNVTDDICLTSNEGTIRCITH